MCICIMWEWCFCYTKWDVLPVNVVLLPLRLPGTLAGRPQLEDLLEAGQNSA